MLPEQLHDALSACTELNPVYRRLVPRLGHAQAIGGDRASAVSFGLEDSAPRCPIRGAWPNGQPHVEAVAGHQDDPGLRSLGYRVEFGTISDGYRMSGSDFRLWFEELKERVPVP